MTLSFARPSFTSFRSKFPQSDQSRGHIEFMLISGLVILTCHYHGGQTRIPHALYAAPYFLAFLSASRDIFSPFDMMNTCGASDDRYELSFSAEHFTSLHISKARI